MHKLTRDDVKLQTFSGKDIDATNVEKRCISVYNLTEEQNKGLINSEAEDFLLPILNGSLMSGRASTKGLSSSSSYPTFIHLSFIMVCDHDINILNVREVKWKVCGIYVKVREWEKICIVDPPKKKLPYKN